jgi:hypothetical protein
MAKPVYEHDCKACIFLGTLKIGYLDKPTQVTDLYICKKPYEVTVVARFSDEESDYGSGLGIPSKELLYATVLAIREGILTQQDLVEHFIDVTR